MTESLNWFLGLLTCKQMSMVPLGTHTPQTRGHVYTLVSVLALTEAVLRGQGIVSLRELSLAVQATCWERLFPPSLSRTSLSSGQQWMISVSKGARIWFGIWTGFLDSPGRNIGR